MNHDCKQEHKLQKICEFKGAAETSIANIEKDIKEIKENDLKHIYDELKRLAGRPTWLISTIMAFLCSALVLTVRELIRALMTRGP